MNPNIVTPIASGIPEPTPDILAVAATESPVAMPKSAFAEAKPQKKKMSKTTIILLAIVLLLVVGGVVVYFVLFNSPSSNPPAQNPNDSSTVVPVDDTPQTTPEGVVVNPDDVTPVTDLPTDNTSTDQTTPNTNTDDTQNQANTNTEPEASVVPVPSDSPTTE